MRSHARAWEREVTISNWLPPAGSHAPAWEPDTSLHTVDIPISVRGCISRMNVTLPSSPAVLQVQHAFPRWSVGTSNIRGSNWLPRSCVGARSPIPVIFSFRCRDAMVVGAIVLSSLFTVTQSSPCVPALERGNEACIHHTGRYCGRGFPCLEMATFSLLSRRCRARRRRRFIRRS